MVDLIIRGGKIIDGSGAPAKQGDLIVHGGKIGAIEHTGRIDSKRERDATGKYVCPGFIDIHSHSDFSLIVNRFAESGIRQGITTVVTGNCGHGPAPSPDRVLAKQNTIGISDTWGTKITWSSFPEYLEELYSPGLSVNVVPLIPHGTVRLAVMGYDARPATKGEIDEMRALVGEAMSAGAAGLSTGLEYSPGRYADEDELWALSEAAAKQGGIYASHIRNRGEEFEPAIQEALTISKRAGLPCQLSHLAPRPYTPEVTFDRVLAMIYHATEKEGMAVGMDTFPDTWGPATLSALLPPWVCDGTRSQVLRRLKSPHTLDKCREYFDNQANYLFRLGGYESLYLARSQSYPELVGKNLNEASDMLGLEPVETVFKILLADGDDFYNVLIRHIFANQEDLDRLLTQPICSLGSDGVLTADYGPLRDFTMNRSSYGYTIRFIQEYVLEREVFTLEEAVRKMTSLPARSANMDNRGILEPGKAADVVILDLKNLRDNSTDDHPQAYPGGVQLVVVNGEIVFENGRHTHALPGHRA